MSNYKYTLNQYKAERPMPSKKGRQMSKTRDRPCTVKEVKTGEVSEYLCVTEAARLLNIDISRIRYNMKCNKGKFVEDYDPLDGYIFADKVLF